MFTEFKNLPKMTKPCIKSYVKSLFSYSYRFDYPNYLPKIRLWTKSEVKIATRTKLINQYTIEELTEEDKLYLSVLASPVSHMIIPWIFWITNFNTELILDTFKDLCSENKPSRESSIMYRILSDTLFNISKEELINSSLLEKEFFSKWSNEEINKYRECLISILELIIFKNERGNAFVKLLHNSQIKLSDNFNNRILCCLINLEDIRWHHYENIIFVLEKLKNIKMYDSTLETLEKLAFKLKRKRSDAMNQFKILNIIDSILRANNKSTDNLTNLIARKTLNSFAS